MVKVRFDIVVVTFLAFLLVILGNSFVNFNKSFFEEQDGSGVLIGYPATEESLAVTTLEELAIATEWGYPFAIVVDSDNIQKTNYYAPLKGDDTVKKMSRFSIWFNKALQGNNYDRIYIVELADEQRVAVRMLDGVLDLSEDMAVLPVGEAEFLSEETEYLTALDEKYDLCESVAKQWYVNASGKDMTTYMDYRDKIEALKTTNWIIVGVIVAFYAIASTVYIVKLRKKNNG